MSEKNKIIELRDVGLFYSRRPSLLKVKKQDKFWALRDVSFSVNKGETFGVIGRNGAGKSTIMALLAGILKPDKGFIQINSERVSLLSLQAGFIPYISGRKNIMLNGMLLGMDRLEVEDRLDEIIDFSELGDFIDRPVGTYSSGMMARLGFSTAVHLNAEVILVDEVLGVGDASFRKKSETKLREKITDSKVTTLIVTHNEKTVRDLCQNAVFIEKGKSLYFGDLEGCLGLYNKN